jgi:hypothetical protein
VDRHSAVTRSSKGDTMANTPKPGVHNVPFLDYVAWDALNWSTLKHFRKSAKHGRHALLFPADSTDDLRFGDAFHASVLEPERFEKQYVSMPKFEGHLFVVANLTGVTKVADCTFATSICNYYANNAKTTKNHFPLSQIIYPFRLSFHADLKTAIVHCAALCVGVVIGEVTC